MNVDLILEIDDSAHDVEFCKLESIKFEPRQLSFNFEDGRWIAEHSSFPIDDDNDLDLTIMIAGTPGAECKLKVTIDGREPIIIDPIEPINHNGKAIFSKEINLDV